MDITDEQFNNELKIDLFGTFICAREIAKEMIKAKYGRIINIASMYGLVGNMAATWFALSRGERRRGQPHEGSRGGMGQGGDYRQQHLPGIFLDAADEGYFGNRLVCRLCEKRYPGLGRYGKEGELDTCALFLASKYSSYVNGQNIAVDGGYTAI